MAIKDYILIGFSDGANIVMKYSCRYEASDGKGLKGLIIIEGQPEDTRPKGYSSLGNLFPVFTKEEK